MTLQNHHWIATDLMLPPVSNEDAYAEYVEAQDKSFANGPCDALKFSFGGGSEMSSTHVSLPDPYAYVLRGDEYFGLNLHLIDLRGVPEADVQSCVQCECAYLNEIKHGEYDESSNKYPAEGGGAQCCFGGMQCESSRKKKDEERENSSVQIDKYRYLRAALKQACDRRRYSQERPVYVW